MIRSAIIYSHGPIGPVRTGLLLDLPVRTDTNSGGSRVSKGSSDPLVMVRCDICGWTLSRCVCRSGKDY